jgi:hypothetical protein
MLVRGQQDHEETLYSIQSAYYRRTGEEGFYPDHQ